MTQFIAGITTYCGYSRYHRTEDTRAHKALGLFALRVIVLYDKAVWVAVLLGGLILAHQAQVIVSDIYFCIVLQLFAKSLQPQWTIALTIGIAVTDVEDTGMPDPNISLCVFTTRTDASLTPFSRWALSTVRMVYLIH